MFMTIYRFTKKKKFMTINYIVIYNTFSIIYNFKYTFYIKKYNISFVVTFGRFSTQ